MGAVAAGLAVGGAAFEDHAACDDAGRKVRAATAAGAVPLLQASSLTLGAVVGTGRRIRGLICGEDGDG